MNQDEYDRARAADAAEYNRQDRGNFSGRERPEASFDSTPPPIRELELHLNGSTDFTARGYGRQVRALGGNFTECRGNLSSKRFVHVPNTEAGLDLAAKLLDKFKHSERCVVLRGQTRTSARIVYRVPQTDDMRGFIIRCLGSYVESELRWWELEGRAAAEVERAREEARRAEQLRDFPKEIAQLVARGRALGAKAADLRRWCLDAVGPVDPEEEP